MLALNRLQEKPMRAALLLIAICFAITACNKSSPPPQQPLKPRTIAVGGG